MQTRNTIFTRDDANICIIPNQGNESSDEAICRPCGVTILASRRVSTSSEFSDKVNSGSPEYTITYQGRPHTRVSIMEFRNGKVVHETQYFSRIPSTPRPGGVNGFSGLA